MKKIISIILTILFIISGCTTEGVNSSLYKDGEEAITIINKSFELKQKITIDDSQKLRDFFEKYKYPEDENFKNINEEFAYWIGVLEISKSRYVEF